MSRLKITGHKFVNTSSRKELWVYSKDIDKVKNKKDIA